VNRDNPDYYHDMTEGEFDQAEAELGGQRYPERAWLLSSRDAWYPNPAYVGTAVRHPEDIDYEDEDERVID